MMKIRSTLLAVLGLASSSAIADLIFPNAHTINPVGIGTCQEQSSGSIPGQCLAPMANAGNPEASCGYRRLSENPFYYFQDCTPNYTTVTSSPSEHGPVLLFYPVENTGANVETQPLMLAACLLVPGRSNYVNLPAIIEFGTDDARKFRIEPCTNIGEIPLYQSAYRSPNTHEMVYSCHSVVPEEGIPSTKPLSNLDVRMLNINSNASLYAECPVG